jgi:hypothetical protein
MLSKKIIAIFCCENLLSKQSKLFSQIMQFDVNSEKNPRPLSQATASNHSNVFTFTLLLSEGRAGEAWEPSNKTMLFLPPRNKVSLTSPMTFHVHLLFCYAFYLFLSDTKPVHILCKQNSQFLNVKAGGTYSNHCTAKGWNVSVSAECQPRISYRYMHGEWIILFSAITGLQRRMQKVVLRCID